MQTEFLHKYGAPVPRYTSYPTAPQFHDAIGAADYRQWLAAAGEGSDLSLYFHIPYCDTLCWFCGCNTKIVRRYDPIETYLAGLLREIDTVAAELPANHRVTHMHWGGGSPDILSPTDIARLAGHARARFRFADDHEFAVEIDPRGGDEDRINALAEAGITRLSIGVQDFDPRVQQAINRHQSFEETRRVVERFRARGVASVNIDLIYGLPYQTRRSIEKTARAVLTLEPDRLAIFGYAHLPGRIKHQRMIDDASLPGLAARFELAGIVGDLFAAAGYKRIGLDHFARPGDPLASGRVRRNFQGYTTDGAECLIGLGASAIGRLRHGYVQNAVPAGDYLRRIGERGLATVRGFRLDTDDEVRALTIDRLMCELQFDRETLRDRFGAGASGVIAEAEALVAGEHDGLIEPTAGGFRVTEKGRPFLRTICARFDRYLATSPARHSLGV